MCEKYSVENGSTSVPAPSVIATAAPVPGARRSAKRATSSQQDDRRYEDAEQPERPRHRRVVGDRLARRDRARRAVAVLLRRQRARGPRRAAVGLRTDARVVREPLGAEPVERGVQRQRREDEPGRFDGVVVTVRVGDVVRLPVPAIDLRGAVRERLRERHVRRLRPAGRLHDERARARKHDQGSGQPAPGGRRCVSRPRPGLDAHGGLKAKRCEASTCFVRANDWPTRAAAATPSSSARGCPRRRARGCSRRTSRAGTCHAGPGATASSRARRRRPASCS